MKRGVEARQPIITFSSIVGDTLSRLIHYCCEKRLIKGFKVGNSNVEVSHLQYVDDTLLFCSDEKGNLGLVGCGKHFSFGGWS